MRTPVLAVVATLAAGTLAAQQPADTAITLTPIVVTATRLPTSLDAVPASVTVIRGDDLRARALASVAEALRVVAGVHVVQSGSPGSVTSLFMRGSESDHVRVLVDGAPVNGPGGTLNLADLTLDDVERIEIVAGPASVLYGSDAVSGVIQIITRHGDGPVRLTASVLGGDHDGRRVDGSLRGGSRRAGFAVAGSASGTDGVYDLNSRYRNQAAQASVRARPTGNSDLTLSARYTRGRLGFPTDFAAQPSDSNQRSENRATTVALDAGMRVAPRIEVRLLGTWVQGDDRYDNPPDTAPTNFAYHSTTGFGRRAADLRANLAATAAATITMGATYETQRASSADSAGSTTGGYFTTATALERQTRTIYAQVQSQAAGPFALAAGVRHDDNSLYGSFVSWRAGAALHLARRTRLHLSAGTAFKEPAPYEVLSTAFSEGNPGLDPERSLALEMGLLQRLVADRLELRLALFGQRFRDLVQYVPSGTLAPGSYRNVAQAEARGGEVWARLAVTSALAFTAQWTHLVTEVTDSGAGYNPAFVQGQPLLRRPGGSGSLSAELRLGSAGRATVRVLHVGRRADVDPVLFTRITMPAHTRVDLGGEATVLPARGWRPGLAALGRVDNLLDARYEEVAGYPAMGRRVLVGMRVDAGR